MKKPMKDRKYTRKEFTSEEAKHTAKAKSPQAGIANIPGIDMQRFFSYVKFDTQGSKVKWLRVMDEKVRGRRFNYWIRQLREEFGFPDMYTMGEFMGLNHYMMNRLAYRNSRPVSLGFVLDLCYIFQKDPTEIFPELIWLRDLWMKDHLMMLEAAIASCEAGELRAVRQILETMKSGSSHYPFEVEEDPGFEVLLKTKAKVTEAQAMFYGENRHYFRKDNQWISFVMFEEMFNDQVNAKVMELRKNFDEIQEKFKTPKS